MKAALCLFVVTLLVAVAFSRPDTKEAKSDGKDVKKVAEEAAKDNNMENTGNKIKGEAEKTGVSPTKGSEKGEGIINDAIEGFSKAVGVLFGTGKKICDDMTKIGGCSGRGH